MANEPARRGRAATGLRLAGATYSEIAEVLGYADARQARMEVLNDLTSLGDDEEGRDTLREIEGERLNRLLRGVWSKAIDSTDPQQIPAIRTALSIIDRRAKLYGLDAPEEVIIHTPTLTELEQWVAKVIDSPAPKMIEGEILEDL